MAARSLICVVADDVACNPGCICAFFRAFPGLELCRSEPYSSRVLELASSDMTRQISHDHFSILQGT